MWLVDKLGHILIAKSPPIPLLLPLAREPYLNKQFKCAGSLTLKFILFYGYY